MNATNGGCSCSDCATLPVVVPIDHAPRLEADGDIWPSAT